MVVRGGWLRMELTKELFVIPHEDRFILYAPLKKAVAEVNGDMIGLLKRVKAGESIGDLEKRLDSLRQIGIVTDGETPIPNFVPERDYNPTAVTLIPTLDCNLRCKYCYSAAGEETGKIMDKEIAKAAIDFVVKNALDKNKKQIELGFHGGGEPFLPQNMSLVQWAFDYFKDQGENYNVQTLVSAVTNGVMSRKTLEWITSNFDEVSISFDGPEDIQNSQRPLKNGGKSFPSVLKTVEYLESIKFRYNLRSVITQGSVSRMPEIVEFFNSIAPSIDHFTFEPLFECGRCDASNLISLDPYAKSPNPKDYVKYLIEARKTAAQFDKTARYACSDLEGVSNYFCSAVESGFFFVLPSGDVTSCLEICRKSDSRSQTFMIGKYDTHSKDFIFYMDRIATLRSRTVDKVSNCSDCFAKYNCAGDCPARCYTESGSLFDTSKNRDRCEMAQGMVKQALIDKLKGGDKND